MNPGSSSRRAGSSNGLAPGLCARGATAGKGLPRHRNGYPDHHSQAVLSAGRVH
jgi:hypothetical protein